MAHGGRKLSWDELRNYDVVLTSYNTLAAEYKRWNTFITEQHAAGRLLDRDIDEGPLRKNFPLMGPKSLFYRVILDEAQCIKNKNTMAAKAAYHLKSITRICLTGTPMMNNVGELFSLIHFLRIRPYSDYKKFQEVSHPNYIICYI
jgi:SNF2 family DNA or RNA helicase